jgi:hypothetical protein
VMGIRLIVLNHIGWFLQKGRRKAIEPGNGYRFKRVGRLSRRPSATNGESILRRDEESACAHKLDDPQLPRKASVELTANGTKREALETSRAARVYLACLSGSGRCGEPKAS